MLPVSTADCETRFSTINKVKTDLRNKILEIDGKVRKYSNAGYEK